MPSLIQVKEFLSRNFKRSTDVATGIASVSAAFELLSGDPAKDITVVGAIAIFAKASEGIQKISGVLLTHKSSTEGDLDRSERIQAAYALLRQRVYFAQLAKALSKLPVENTAKKINLRRFSNLLGDQNRPALDALSFESVGQDDEFFQVCDDCVRLLLFDIISNSEIDKLLIALRDDVVRSLRFSIAADKELKDAFEVQSLVNIHSKLDRIGSLDSIAVTNAGVNQEPSLLAGQGYHLSSPSSDAQIAEIRRILGVSPNIDFPDVGVSSIASKIKSQFEDARKQLEKGEILRAKQTFVNIVELLESELDEGLVQIRARSISNIGVCLLREGATDEAIANFDLSFELYPSHLNISVLHGFSLHLKGETGLGIDFLMALLPGNEGADSLISMLTQLIQIRDGAERALDFISDNFLETRFCYELRSQILLALGRNVESEGVAQSGLKKFPKSGGLHLAKGAAIGADILNERDLSVDAIEKEQIARLENARDHLKLGIDSRDIRGVKEELQSGLVNLGLVYTALGSENNAGDVFREVLKIDPSDTRAMRGLLALPLSQVSNKEALDLAAKLYELEKSLSSAYPLMTVLIDGRRYKRLDQFIGELQERFPEAASDYAVQTAKLEYLVKSHYREDAENFAKELESRLSDDPFILLALARFYNLRKDWNQSERIFMKALGVAGVSQGKIISRAFGLFLHSRKRWGEAITYFERGALDPHRGDFLGELAHCYFQIGNFKKAYDLIGGIDLYESDCQLLDLKSIIEIDLRDYSKAKETLEVLAERGGDKDSAFRLASVYQRLEMHERSSEVLRDVYDANSGDVDVISFLAHVSYDLGYHELGFSYSKEAFSLDPSNPQVRTLVGRVIMAGAGNVKISAEDAKMVSECLTDNPNFERIETVSKEDGSIDIEPLLLRIKDYSDSNNKILKEYIKSEAPLAFLVESSGKDVWTTWSALTADPGGKIFMSSGTTSERVEEHECARSSKSIVLDFSSVLTLHSIGMLRCLNEVYDEVLVPSSLIADFVLSQRDYDDFHGESGTLAYSDGSYRYFESRQDVRGDALGNIKSILDYLKSDSVRLVGLRPEILEKWRDESLAWSELSEMIFIPIGVSIGENIPLLSDQRIIRSLVKTESGIQSFSSLAFLGVCLDRNLISEEKYLDSVLDLISKNYQHIGVSSRLLMRSLERENFNINPLSVSLMERVNDPVWVNPFSARLLGNAAILIWLKAPPGKKASLIRCIAAILDKFEQPELYPDFVGGVLSVAFNMPSSVFGLLGDILNYSESDNFKSFIFNFKISLRRMIRRVVRRGYFLDREIVRTWSSQIALEHMLYFND